METLFYGSSGPNVKLIQSLLNKIGYNAGQVDGVFGYLTWQAVMAFQKNNGLIPDGVVGSDTWNIFEVFLQGYDTYTIRPGDSLYNIAARYYTTLNAILTANPGVSPNSLMIGQQIIVPYGIDVVYTDIDYTYEILERQIQGLRVRYPFIETGVAGNSVMGKNLYYIRLGRGSNQVSYNATHHANEGITTLLLMKFIENLAKAYSVGGTLGGYSIPNIWLRSSLYIVPLVNPDGLDLVNYWPNYTNPVYQNATSLNKTGLPIPSVWKANIRGTDLNLNYPADWDKEHEIEIQQGITGPAPRDYGGPAPLSEPESASMVNMISPLAFLMPKFKAAPLPPFFL